MPRPQSIACDRYAAYTRSPEWRARRAVYFRRYKVSTCAACGASGLLDLHHLTYARVGEELDTDLTAVCRSCHFSLHALPERQQRQIAPPASATRTTKRLAATARRQADREWLAGPDGARELTPTPFHRGKASPIRSW